MDQQKAIVYFEEVGLWAKQVKNLMKEHDMITGPFKGLDEDLTTLIGEIDELINNQPITEEAIEDMKQVTGLLFNEVSNLFQINDRQAKNQRVPIGKHVLPPLPYSYDALEPYISAEIMKLHHQTHHKGYVDGLNKAESMMEKARMENDFDLLKHWEREAAFHGSGHYLHSIFWFVMKPKGGGQPTGTLAGQIQKDFGSFDKFKKHFTEAAKKVEGVGWALLVWSPRSHRLEILQTEKHQLFTQWDTIPLLVLDVWEHAYYLQYKANKDEYINNWWNVVNWDEVEDRYNEASKLKWTSY